MFTSLFEKRVKCPQCLGEKKLYDTQFSTTKTCHLCDKDGMVLKSVAERWIQQRRLNGSSVIRFSQSVEYKAPVKAVAPVVPRFSMREAFQMFKEKVYSWIRLNIIQEERCPQCFGKKMLWDTRYDMPKRCSLCDGHGMVRVKRSDTWKAFIAGSQPVLIPLVYATYEGGR